MTLNVQKTQQDAKELGQYLHNGERLTIGVSKRITRYIGLFKQDLLSASPVVSADRKNLMRTMKVMTDLLM